MKISKLLIWFYVHFSMMYLLFLLLITAAIGSVFVLPVIFTVSMSVKLFSIGLWIIISLVVFFSIMCVLSYSLFEKLLDRISYFDKGVQYQSCSVDDYKILLFDGKNIRKLSPRALYSHEVFLDDDNADRKVMVFTRCLNADATPLEKKFFEKIRKDFSHGHIIDSHNCKYGRVLEYK